MVVSNKTIIFLDLENYYFLKLRSLVKLSSIFFGGGNRVLANFKWEVFENCVTSFFFCIFTLFFKISCNLGISYLTDRRTWV